MAKLIATDSAIDEAIDVIVSRGEEPSTKNIQAQIGGGSYTTVAKGLERWRSRRDASIVVPAEVQDRANRHLHEVWSIAKQMAQRDVDAIRTQTQEQLAQAAGDLKEASTEIARLEALNAAQEAQLEAFKAEMRSTQDALNTARIEAARAESLDQALMQVRTELDHMRRTAENRGAETARLTGERDSARSQLRDLMAVLRPADVQPVPAELLQTDPADPSSAVDPVLYSYRCAKCSKRGEMRLDGDGHDGEMAKCENCHAPVQLEWDGGVSLHPVAPAAESRPESEPQTPDTP